MKKQKGRTEDHSLVFRDLEFIVSFTKSISHPWLDPCHFRCLHLPDPPELLSLGSFSGLAARSSGCFIFIIWLKTPQLY